MVIWVRKNDHYKVILMSQSALTTPILFLVFNRPATTQIVFDVIREVRPTKLYVVADGPRKNKPEEIEKCKQVRAIVTSIDWDCELKTLMRDENFGCGKSVSTGINWFFENEPEGIILEDDCVPNASFFPYCTELLERYRHDLRVMEISGNNIRPEKFNQREYSYSFSAHNGIWGWASWRRAWDLYDYEMKQYKKIKAQKYLRQNFNSIFEEDYFNWVFERTYLFPHITWDYQWEFAKRINSGVTIVPQKNLVVNIGFGTDATSTTSSMALASSLKSELLTFPLRHPPYVIVDKEADKHAFITYMTSTNSRIKSHLKNILPAGVRDRIFKRSMLRFITSQLNRRPAFCKRKKYVGFFLAQVLLPDSLLTNYFTR